MRNHGFLSVGEIAVHAQAYGVDPDTATLEPWAMSLKQCLLIKSCVVIGTGKAPIVWCCQCGA